MPTKLPARLFTLVALALAAASARAQEAAADALPGAAASSTAPALARLVAVGDMDQLLLGQEGYCGVRSHPPKPSWKNIPLQGDRPTWMRVGATIPLHAHCTGEFSFTPKAGTAYILRYSMHGNRCLFELFRVVPGADPVRERLTPEQPRSCLLE